MKRHNGQHIKGTPPLIKGGQGRRDIDNVPFQTDAMLGLIGGMLIIIAIAVAVRLFS